MKREISPNSLSNIVSFPTLPFDSVSRSRSVTGDALDTRIFGHVSQDGCWAYIAKGSTLEVFSMNHGERHSSWCFGTAVKDRDVNITSVAAFTSPESPWLRLIVGLEWPGGGLLCLYDVKTSKVVTALELPHKVTSVEVVCKRGGIVKEVEMLSPELQCMCGVVAVGTEGGYIMLVDLCLEDEKYSNEQTRNQALITMNCGHDMAAIRASAMDCNKQMCLLLNGDSINKDKYCYRSKNSSLLKRYFASEVFVSTMRFIPQAVMLAVGFSFGGVQLWSLQSLSLMYTLNLDPDVQSPVVALAYQEPENDPRHYCYLWVVSGQTNAVNDYQDIMTYAALYSLAFQKIERLDRSGYFYQGLESCRLRFTYPLNLLPHDPMSADDTVCSRLISCNVIQPAELLELAWPEQDDSLHIEDWNANHDLNLCILAWESWHGSHEGTSAIYVALFDINQWYKAHMPNLVSGCPGELCSYIGVFDMFDVADKFGPHDILDAYINPVSLAKLVTEGWSDQFFYPSSLSFSMKCLSEIGAVHVSYLGLQRQILQEMSRSGPICIVDPKKSFQVCSFSGLLPHPGEMSGSCTSQELMRKRLLTLLLEMGYCNFISSCIKDWATGDYHQNGCTLRFLLDWAWERVTYIKNSVDKLSIPLFNCSNINPNHSTIKLLHSYRRQLERLAAVFHILQDQPGPTTEQGQRELELRREVTQLIATYLHVILWMHYCQLLPECGEGEHSDGNEVVYPATVLKNSYLRSRQSLTKIHTNVGSAEILLIDGLTREIGLPLTSLWEKSGGSALYPPPSLYACLGIYLLEGVSLQDKHRITFYLLLDIAEYLGNHIAENIGTFSSTFQLQPSWVKLTKGFWSLDHKQFEEALAYLLHPIVNPADITAWQHIHIIKSFLYQGEHEKALHYVTVRRPPLQTPEEIKLHLTVLLANEKTSEAFDFQRQYRDMSTSEDLLNHFFVGCQQTCMLYSMLQLPFSQAEEEALVNFLENNLDPRAQEVLVMYFLQSSKPLEAARLNERLRQDIMARDSKAVERAVFRNAIVSGFLDTLPQAQQKLELEVKARQHRNFPRVGKGKCPSPLSTTVHAKNLVTISQSELMRNAMEKFLEIQDRSSWELQSPLDAKRKDHASWRSSQLSFAARPLFTEASNMESEPTEMIFPTPVKREHATSLLGEMANSSRRTRFSDISPIKHPSSDRRRNVRHIGAEALSLLQTPPICRKTLVLHSRHTDMASTPIMDATPQSILKVRNSPKVSLTHVEPMRISTTLTETKPVMDDEMEVTEDAKVTSTIPHVREDARLLRFQEPKEIIVKKMPHKESTQTEFQASPRRPLRSDVAKTPVESIERNDNLGQQEIVTSVSPGAAESVMKVSSPLSILTGFGASETVSNTLPVAGDILFSEAAETTEPFSAQDALIMTAATGDDVPIVSDAVSAKSEQTSVEMATLHLSDNIQLTLPALESESAEHSQEDSLKTLSQPPSTPIKTEYELDSSGVSCAGDGTWLEPPVCKSDDTGILDGGDLIQPESFLGKSEAMKMDDEVQQIQEPVALPPSTSSHHDASPKSTSPSIWESDMTKEVFTKPFEGTRSRLKSMSPVTTPLKSSEIPPAVTPPPGNKSSTRRRAGASATKSKEEGRSTRSERRHAASTEKVKPDQSTGSEIPEFTLGEDSVEGEIPEFTFAEPKISESAPVPAASTTATPPTMVPSFVFSPPLTRSRSRRTKPEDSYSPNTSSLSVSSTLPKDTHSRPWLVDPLLEEPLPLAFSSASVTNASKVGATRRHLSKKVSQRGRMKGQKSPADDEINLVSPDISLGLSSTHSRKNPSIGHSMTLRTSRLKARKFVRL